MAHGPTETVIHRTHSSKSLEITHNLLVALTVSFVALSLGAAFGVLSGRGAFAGMFSAGLIAIITGALGGTRVQCSGPVAPMAAIMATFFALANSEYLADPMALGGVTPAHFLNLVCFICGVLMVAMAALRTGFLISYVPDAVISGFMTGIALIIWIGQGKFLFGLNGATQISGDQTLNIVITVLTIAMTFLTYPLLRRINTGLARVMPGTLMALLVATIVATMFKFNIQHVAVESSISGWQGFVDLVKANIPHNISWTLSSPAPIAAASFADTIPCAASIATCAFDPATSCRHSRLSNGMLAFISRITAAGPSANRPPHI